MILHTVLSLEEVLAGQNEIKAPETAFKKGHMVEVDGSGNIVRLLSSNPFDYLDQNFSPGVPLKNKK